MNDTTWHCDDYGTQNLRPTVNGCTGHVWLQGRRPYCDRGHWEWGFEGLPIRPEDLPSSSYYFMRKERLMAEVEEWVARAAGSKFTGSDSISSMGDETAMASGESRQLGARWNKVDDHTLQAQVRQPEGGTFQATLREQNTSTGPVFVFTVDELEVDSADRFPRVYLDLQRALAEAEEFFAWRLLKIPAEIPGPLQEPDISIGEVLAQALKPSKVRRARP